ncbi:MAG: dihydroneopterin aldolase [Bacteroidales bacterium]|nr:dihydroneopterin aldolase [Bacteroidales bacterium]
MVRLNNMQFRGYHGCLESERRDGNWFRVDFTYDYDMRAAARTDDLTYAVDYSAIYAVIGEQMARPANLLEHLAKRTLDAIIEKFPQIERAELTVTKFNPPLDGPVESSSVTVRYE